MFLISHEEYLNNYISFNYEVVTVVERCYFLLENT